MSYTESRGEPKTLWSMFRRHWRADIGRNFSRSKKANLLHRCWIKVSAWNIVIIYKDLGIKLKEPRYTHTEDRTGKQIFVKKSEDSGPLGVKWRINYINQNPSSQWFFWAVKNRISKNYHYVLLLLLADIYDLYWLYIHIHISIYIYTYTYLYIYTHIHINIY